MAMSDRHPAPEPVDVFVGARLAQRRVALGLSQTVLAEALGVSFQQVQKYERGRNRISASRLHRAASVLDWPVENFFPARVEATGSPRTRQTPVDHAAHVLLRIEPPKVRRAVLTLVTALSAEG